MALSKWLWRRESEAIIQEIHQVTAICADAQRNLDFYAGFLGLQLGKMTVNFDDPSTYHLFLGAGRFDPIVPTQNVGTLAQMLREAGANVSLNWVETGHHLSVTDVELVRAWLEF